MFGERIRFLRKQAKLSQLELAERTGVSRPNISFWENAEYPPLEAIAKVCRVMGIEIWEFFLTEEIKTQLTETSLEISRLLDKLSTLDKETCADVLEVFYLILNKYEKSVAKEMPDKKPYNVTYVYGKETYDLSKRLPYYARNAGKIALEQYFSSFAWVTH